MGLTGTPSSNGLMDLWAEFRLLDMGQRLGRFIGQYRTRFFQPDKRNGQVVFSYKPLPGAEREIYRLISDITISMKSTDHLRMPELVNSRHTVYAESVKFALLFEFDGDVRAIRHVLYNCSASRPSIESETKEDTIEPGTETLSITADPRADGLVKARTGDTTDAAAYVEWYNNVYIPAEQEAE